MNVRICFNFIVLLQLLFFQSCHGEYMTDLDRTLNKVAKKTAEEIEVQMPFLELIGMGGSLSEDNKEIVFEKLAFNSSKKLTGDGGVVLLSQIVSKYLEVIYADKSMQEYLGKLPFTYKNIHIKIFVYS